MQGISLHDGVLGLLFMISCTAALSIGESFPAGLTEEDAVSPLRNYIRPNTPAWEALARSSQ